MEERSLDYYLDNVRIGTAFSRLPPGPLYPAVSAAEWVRFLHRVSVATPSEGGEGACA
jgi:hypothetical protein